ncbi:hypothetical protein MHF_1462 [Mycoplasma haemofelis Ohio2]|uniref:Uncharacterized protein n=1 Tax=Mycoplasma haemofelis (strain Ohio2) TaxID=859194 RepID=F6FGY7_MYCHI|nr:hypothetical protein MHF_1462 [Mycoplasma haemofelis Ohio2]
MDAKLLSIPAAVTGGAGSIYLGYQYLPIGNQKVSIKSKLGDLLLKFDEGFTEKWKVRATLVSSKEDLPDSLKKLRTSSDNKTISDANIKKWCQEQIESEFTSETDPLFISIRDYCTFNNKDKLGSKAISEELTGNNIQQTGKWTKANQKLTSAQETDMRTVMKDIKAKLAATAGTAKDDKALRTWCEGIYLAYFKGDKDADFRDAKIYCVESQ